MGLPWLSAQPTARQGAISLKLTSREVASGGLLRPRVRGREGAELRAAAAASGQVAKIRTVEGSGCRSAGKKVKTC